MKLLFHSLLIFFFFCCISHIFILSFPSNVCQPKQTIISQFPFVSVKGNFHVTINESTFCDKTNMVTIKLLEVMNI